MLAGLSFGCSCSLSSLRLFHCSAFMNVLAVCSKPGLPTSGHSTVLHQHMYKFEMHMYFHICLFNKNFQQVATNKQIRRHTHTTSPAIVWGSLRLIPTDFIIFHVTKSSLDTKVNSFTGLPAKQARQKGSVIMGMKCALNSTCYGLRTISLGIMCLGFRLLVKESLKCNKF